MKHPAYILRICGSVVILLLLAGAAICLIKYAGWSAVTSAYYGLPNSEQIVSRASHAATPWFWGLISLGITATAVTALLLPISWERLSPGLNGTIRILLAIIVVAVGTTIIGDILIVVGHHVR